VGIELLDKDGTADAKTESPVAADDALVVTELCSAYDEQRVLHGISLRVAAGSCVAVLGANGAGKTTLLNTIAGLHRASEGSVSLCGARVDRWPAYRISRRGICYIPEGRGIFPHMSVAENLRLSVGRSGDRLAAVYETFPALRQYVHRRAGSMSGGEQQMLAMAPAVVVESPLLLVDELSLGLAPLVVKDLFEQLVQIRARGTAILLVDQFAERALTLAEHAYVIRKGEIVYDGSPDALRADAEYLQRLYIGG
jgi:branched-chain amino acid transport system ATP-binding protein